MELIIAILAGNCENTIEMTIDSVIDYADDIVIVYDTTSKDRTYEIIKAWKIKHPNKITIIKREYEHGLNIKNANSNARTCYLNYLKETHLGKWCLVLDADEVCNEQIKDLKDNLKNSQYQLMCPKIIHFIEDFGHEDATQEVPYVMNRLFYIDKNLYYPDGEHPVLQHKNKMPPISFNLLTIYHLGYIPNLNYFIERY